MTQPHEWPGALDSVALLTRSRRLLAAVTDGLTQDQLLQFDTFGGSGYDIACAGADGPILYKKEILFLLALKIVSFKN